MINKLIMLQLSEVPILQNRYRRGSQKQIFNAAFIADTHRHGHMN